MPRSPQPLQQGFPEKAAKSSSTTDKSKSNGEREVLQEEERQYARSSGDHGRKKVGGGGGPARVPGARVMSTSYKVYVMFIVCRSMYVHKGEFRAWFTFAHGLTRALP